MGEKAQAIFEAFVRQVADVRCGPLVIACPPDGAGLAAGELARRAFAQAAAHPPVVIAPGKAEFLVASLLAERARDAGAGALLALDLGANAAAILPGMPTLFIDLHRHEANLAAPVIEPDSDALARPAGVVLYELLPAACPSRWPSGLEHFPEPDSLAWLAAIAAEAGHPKTTVPDEWLAGKRGLRRAAREVAVLLNAAGRASQPQTSAALTLLARRHGPEEFLADESPEMQALREARAEVMRESAHWSRTRPHFMWRVALVPVASPCRIEPILAAMWERQLKKYMVVVANSGYAPGLVTIVARTASADRNLLRLLDAVAPQGLSGPIALGTRDYVEAVIPRAAWTAMLQRMRFRQTEKLIPPPQEASLF